VVPEQVGRRGGKRNGWVGGAMREGRKTCSLGHALCRVRLYVWAENGLTVGSVRCIETGTVTYEVGEWVGMKVSSVPVLWVMVMG